MVTKSTSETGHAVNITNLEKLWSATKSWGTDYNPSNADLKATALKAEVDAERGLLKTLNDKATPWVNAVNTREDIIAGLSKLCRRIYESVASTNATANFIKDVQSLVKKITGVRVSPKLVMTKDNPPLPAEKSVKQISASQMGIDNRLNHFDALIQLLKSEPLYVPNETDLATTALDAKYAAISGANSAVIAALPDFENARIALKEKMYLGPKCGSELAGKCKKYIRSAFGPTSPQYKQISALKFTKPSK